MGQIPLANPVGKSRWQIPGGSSTGDDHSVFSGKIRRAGVPDRQPQEIDCISQKEPILYMRPA